MLLHERFSEEELALLKQRAERVAAPVRDEAGSDSLTALMIVMDSEKFALPIDQIRLVYRNVPIIPVPCVPDFVAGIANIRGHLVSVLDLATILGLESKGDTTESALIVAEARDASIGFRAEMIGEVIELSRSQMNAVPTDINISRPEYLQGIFPNGTALLDMKTILEDSRLIVDESSRGRPADQRDGSVGDSHGSHPTGYYSDGGQFTASGANRAEAKRDGVENTARHETL